MALSGRHELYVSSLAALLASRGAQTRVVEDLATIATAPVEDRADVLLLESPLSTELEQLPAGTPPLVVLTDHARSPGTGQAPEIGAGAVLEKNASLGELSLAIADALEGRPGVGELTRRQRQVLRLLADGLDNAEIAAQLDISQRTARAHVSSVLDRLQVANRTQAAVTAVKSGWVTMLLVAMLAVSLVGTGVAQAATPAQALARKISAQMRAVGGASGAWVADSTSEKELFAWSSNRKRVPASVQKLFTTSTALERFGEQATLPTVVRTDGPLSVDGTLAGNLYIKGFGDPSFGSARMSELADAIEAADVGEVTGRVYGDETHFDSRRGVPASGFRVSSYIGPLSALAFNSGTLRGFGRGFQSNPPKFVAGRLRSALASHGVEVDGGARAGAAPEAARDLASVSSPELAALVRSTNQPSNNYFAEMLLKGLGARFGSGGSTAGGASVVKRFERELGLSSNVIDGSGLSRANATSPRTVGRLLLNADDESWFSSFYRSLPLAGHSGTLHNRMEGTRAEGRCRAKTGTLAGVSALAGYCRSRSGKRVIFALLMNGVNVAIARRAQDRIAAALAGYSG